MTTLKNGSRGDAVKLLQTLLNADGAQLKVDGIFGAKTEAAVKAFQAAHSLTVDGIVGVKTWAALGYKTEAHIIECEDLKQYSEPHGSMIYGKDKTYSTYRSGGCGVTSFAIVQRAYGLAPEGESGTETIQRLGEYSSTHGYRVKGAGTNAGLFKTNGTTYTTTYSAEVIEAAIREDKLVIMCIRKGFDNGYTGLGHYVVAYGIDDNGYVLLRDVGASAASRQKARLSRITTGLKCAYVMRAKEWEK